MPKSLSHWLIHQRENYDFVGELLEKVDSGERILVFVRSTGPEDVGVLAAQVSFLMCMRMTMNVIHMRGMRGFSGNLVSRRLITWLVSNFSSKGS